MACFENTALGREQEEGNESCEEPFKDEVVIGHLGVGSACAIGLGKTPCFTPRPCLFLEMRATDLLA